MPVHHFNTFPLCQTGMKQKLKQARSGGMKNLCQGEANMGSRKARFIVVSGEGKACGEQDLKGGADATENWVQMRPPMQEEAK